MPTGHDPCSTPPKSSTPVRLPLLYLVVPNQTETRNTFFLTPHPPVLRGLYIEQTESQVLHIHNPQ